MDLGAIEVERDPDVSLELSRNPRFNQRCLSRIRVGGAVILAGSVSPTPPVPLDPEHLVRRVLTVRGVHNYGPRHLKAALSFLENHQDRYSFDELIPEALSLEQAEGAFAAAMFPQGQRVAVMPVFQ